MSTKTHCCKEAFNHNILLHTDKNMVWVMRIFDTYTGKETVKDNISYCPYYGTELAKADCTVTHTNGKTDTIEFKDVKIGDKIFIGKE